MKGEPIPRHFQEAGLLLADKDSISLSSYSIQPEIVDRYREFKQVWDDLPTKWMCLRCIDNLEIPIGIITISRSLKEKNNEAIIYLLDYRLSFGTCGL